MVERKQKAQEEIQVKIEDKRKADADKMDKEYAQMISVQEQEKLEKERAAKNLQSERDNQAYQIVAEFGHIEY